FDFVVVVVIEAPTKLGRYVQKKRCLAAEPFFWGHLFLRPLFIAGDYDYDNDYDNEGSWRNIDGRGC
ncbi:MAG: hypothetical protein R3336_07345, partial [Phycisphaeraceae bacterium]|nr:hypothetical protein [Phycisphaeraceae bacterium]